MVQGAAGLIDFLKMAFGAREVELLSAPDGTVMHGEVLIGDSIIMIDEAHEPFGAMPSMVHLYVDDFDAMYQSALRAGATLVEEPKSGSGATVSETSRTLSATSGGSLPM